MVPEPRVHQVKSKPAPVGGINAESGISIMPETDAINLVNWIPDTFGVRTRKGYKEWATAIGAELPITSILSWIGPGTTLPAGSFLTDPTAMPGKLFAASDDAIYDVTDLGTAPAVSRELSNASGAGWLHSTMLTNSAGAHLLVCSEADGYFYFNGTTWATPTLTGVSASSLVFPLVWKRRAWFVERNTTKAWYGATDSLTGTFTAFDFGPLFKKGGHLSFLASWTIDAGEGIDDLFVAVSSGGDVVVYKGSDPASAATFGLVGTWSVGQIPVGRRAFMQYGGDLVLLSSEGVVPISQVTRGGSTLLQATGAEYSSHIRSLLGADMRATFANLGWQMLLHPSERIAICTVPNYSKSRNRQYALATGLNKWTTFQGMPINCLGSSAGYTFAGTEDGRVLLLFTGYFDNVQLGESTGPGIEGTIQTAFSYFDAPALEKLFLMIRPSFLSTVTPAVLASVNVNFAIKPPVLSPTYGASSGDLWDTGAWNSALWAGQVTSYASWVGVGGVGFAGAAALSTVCVGDTILTSIDYMYKVGGPL